MKRWYNNGIVERQFEENTQPNGFVRGRMPFSEAYTLNQRKAQMGHKPTFTRKHTEEEKAKISNTLKASGGNSGSFKPGEKPWSYGLTADIDERVANMVERCKEGTLKKYGVDNYWKSDEAKEKIPEMLEKQYETKKKNHSFKSSNPEKVLIEYYKSIYGDDIITQYKDKRYPFRCDIYIKSLDKFIEFNGSFTHQNCAFNKDNPNHILILEELKRKEKEKPIPNYYTNVIDTWTRRDVEKLQMAQQNNLNYEIIYYTRDKHYYYYSNGITIKYK